MCGRYSRRGDKQKMAEAFQIASNLDDVTAENTEDAVPGSIQPVVCINCDGQRDLTSMRWGFKFRDRLVFNTRSEGVTDVGFWMKPFAEQRCIIPASSFFEWQKLEGQGQLKPKYEFVVPDRPYIGFAGLWSSFFNPKTRQKENTFSILTGRANAIMRPIHDRQPIILEFKDYSRWLSKAERRPVHLLRRWPEKRLTARMLDSASAEPLREPLERGLSDPM
jgi:putative SOS response-associated peptidase YedK